MSDAQLNRWPEVTEFIVDTPEIDGTSLRLGYRSRAGNDTVATFTEVIELPGELSGADAAAVQSMARLLSLAASLSYFKAFAPTDLVIPSGATDTEAAFARQVARNGLGEFAYVNDLPAVLETNVVGPTNAPAAPAAVERPAPRRLLVAVGGGKDSIVSIEALRSAGFEVGLFAVNSYEPIENTATVAGLPLHVARRTLDPTLFEFNAEGAPNGHVPVTAVNSLVALLVAAALGYDTVVFSNEASSSFGNVLWHERIINHQWSKGIEFERLLRESLPAAAPGYVSLLRPLTELRIARRFATHTEYHRAFTSCNRAFKLREGDRTTWCADCPKCRFVFLCLAPFLSRDALLDVFAGRDMFADDEQLGGFLELLGVDGMLKPFECVGQPDECRVALQMIREHDDWKNHPFLSRPEIEAVTASERERDSVFEFRDEHLLHPGLETVARAV